MTDITANAGAHKPMLDAVLRAVTESRQRRLARCYVALSEVDFDLRTWRDELDWSQWAAETDAPSDLAEHTAQGFGLLDGALGRAS